MAMTRMTGGQALVEMLTRNGIETLFALPGVQNDALFVALYDAGEAIRVIHPRHEQAAAYMALGYAKATGKPGAFAVVPGPGLLNTTAALSTAWATNAPVLCISGQIPSDLIGRGFGLLHEIPDQLAILKGLTKYAARINHPTEAGKIVNEAFRQLSDGRSRPVAVEMPLDIMALATDVDLPAGIAAPLAPAPDTDLVDKAADLLAGAKQPLIYVGSGAMAAGAEITALAERLQAPVVTYTGGKGIVSDRHWAAQNMLGGQELWKSCDVALAVGTRLNQPLTRWGTDANIKIIRVDLDPVEISRVSRPAISLVADAKEACAALLAALETRGGKPASRQEELAAVKARSLAHLRERLGPQCEYLDAIRAELPDNGILVEDLTQVGYVARLGFPVYQPRTYINSGYQGTLGFGYATALGVKVAKPDVPVVSLSGDGGFMYNVQELSTAALHGIDAIALVFADGAYGNVRRMQKNDYGNRLIATELLNPNFPKMADSYGIAGVRALSPDELRRELAAAIKRRGPTLIEVPVGEMPDPWPILITGRVRGSR
jgi:acetolactate synthase-1/2/3 large subunit